MSAVAAHDARADFLAAVPIFAGLSEPMCSKVALRSRWVRVRAGEWLFRQGEPGESLYVVRSGRLEILLEELDEEVLRVLKRGAVVGELSLITGSPRSASVRARRDSELLKLDREQFLPLVTEEPDFAMTLTRALGHQLRLSRGLPMPTEVLPTTVAVVPLGQGIPFERFCRELAEELHQWLRVTCLDAEAEDNQDAGYPEVLDAAERENDLVLLLAEPARGPDAWIEFCLRQADRVLVLCGSGARDVALFHDKRLHGADVLSVVSGPTPQPIESLAPRLHRPLPIGDGFTAGVRSIARRLAGRSVGIVLSGGGARGFAHIGVIDELVRAGVALDRIGGCSMGAYIGAMFACGMSCGEMARRCRQEFVERNPLSDYAVPTVSLVRGNRAESMLRRTFGFRAVEWLPADFFCVSCDLVSGELIVHRAGDLAEAVGSSMCLPGIFPPVGRGNRLLVDGGVLNNLPVEPMALSGEGPVIASDVSAHFEVSDRPPRREGRTARAWIARHMAVRGAGTVALPSLKETLSRAMSIGSVDAVAVARKKAEVLIEPETGSVGMFEFKEMDRLIAAGRRAALVALEQGFDRIVDPPPS